MAKYACPCGARYTFPDTAAGKRAKCKKCGEAFTLPVPETEEGVIAIAADEFSFAAEAANATKKADEYARAVTMAQARGVGQTVLETSDADPTPPKIYSRGYAASIADSFLFITSLGNLMIFLAIWFLISGLRLAPFAGVFAFFLYLFVYLWYSAYRYQIVTGAAGGDRNLPELEISRDEIFDYFFDAINWALSWVFVLIPAMGYLAYLVSRGDITWWEGAEMLVGGWGNLIAYYEAYPVFVFLTLSAGVMWPMAVLCLVLGGREAMLRVDMMLVTILRSPGGYLATVVFWAGAVALSALGDWGIGQMNVAGGGGMGAAFIVLILKDGVAIYTGIVALRIIGLYYHHFKDQFAWDWG